MWWKNVETVKNIRTEEIFSTAYTGSRVKIWNRKVLVILYRYWCVLQWQIQMGVCGLQLNHLWIYWLFHFHGEIQGNCGVYYLIFMGNLSKCWLNRSNHTPHPGPKILDLPLCLEEKTKNHRHEKATKYYIWATAWQNQLNGHLPSLIRVFAVCMKKPWVISFQLSAQWILWSDCMVFAGWSVFTWHTGHFVGIVMLWLKVYKHILLKVCLFFYICCKWSETEKLTENPNTF